MAWTTPFTATIGAFFTKANWDTHVRDNLAYLKAVTRLTYAEANTGAQIGAGTNVGGWFYDNTNGPKVTVPVTGSYRVMASARFTGPPGAVRTVSMAAGNVTTPTIPLGQSQRKMTIGISEEGSISTQTVVSLTSGHVIALVATCTGNDAVVNEAGLWLFPADTTGP